MALRQGALHDALLHPGDADLALKAAEEAADYRIQLQDVRADLTLLKWMVGTLVAFQVALGVGNIWLTLNVLARLPK